MTTLKLLFALTFVLLLSNFALAQQTPSAADLEKAEKSFQTANSKMEQGKFAEALIDYKTALVVLPDDPSLLFNGGLAAYRSKDFATAIDLWKRLKSVDSSDWHLRAKLIQAYQAVGKLVERDSERQALFEMWKSGKNPELTKQFEYCREQFEVNGKKVMAFEHFELKGNRALRYVFSVVNKTGDGEEFRISLGSYETTNAIWRETTKPKPEKNARLFHLDGYFTGSHKTYGMYFPEPTYEQTRAKVVKILEGESKTVSSSTFTPQPKIDRK